MHMIYYCSNRISVINWYASPTVTTPIQSLTSRLCLYFCLSCHLFLLTYVVAAEHNNGSSSRKKQQSCLEEDSSLARGLQIRPACVIPLWRRQWSPLQIQWSRTSITSKNWPCWVGLMGAVVQKRIHAYLYWEREREAGLHVTSSCIIENVLQKKVKT